MSIITPDLDGSQEFVVVDAKTTTYDDKVSDEYDMSSDPSEREHWTIESGRDPFIESDKSRRAREILGGASLDSVLWPPKLTDESTSSPESSHDSRRKSRIDQDNLDLEKNPPTGKEVEVAKLKLSRDFTLRPREHKILNELEE